MKRMWLGKERWACQGCRVRGLSFVALVWAVSAGSAGAELQITNVSVDRTEFVSGEAKEVTVSFRTTAPAKLTLNIYDARDYLLRRVRSEGEVLAGDKRLSWDGRDNQGRQVPPEAYMYAISARGADGGEVVYDLSDNTGGQTVYGNNVHYAPETDLLHYSMPYAARVFVRMGIEGGSVQKTIVNGAVRAAGENEEIWDGWDESRVVSLKHHPKREFFVEGFRLSRNAILVHDPGKRPAQPQWLDVETDQAERRSPGIKPRGLNVHAYHSREACRDVALSLSMPEDLPKDPEGNPIISGATPFRIDVAPEDSLIIAAQRFEVVYFLNNKMIYEHETSYTPYTWRWDPKLLSGGTHYMTGFLVTLGGHYGVANVKFSMSAKQASD